MNRRWWSQHPILTGTISGVLATLIATFIVTFAPIIFQSLLSINVVRILGGVSEYELRTEINKRFMEVVGYNLVTTDGPIYGEPTTPIRDTVWSEIEKTQEQLSEANTKINRLRECVNLLTTLQTKSIPSNPITGEKIRVARPISNNYKEALSNHLLSRHALPTDVWNRCTNL